MKVKKKHVLVESDVHTTLLHLRADLKLLSFNSVIKYLIGKEKKRCRENENETPI